MNKAALMLLVLVNSFRNYFPHTHTFSEDTTPRLQERMFKKMGVHAYDTKDEEGGE